jgi:hypothetical protein
MVNRKRKAELQALIDAAAAANAAAFLATTALDEYCQERWGYTPSDIDADDIIDAVLGGCGVASGMSAEDFVNSMKRKQ